MLQPHEHKSKVIRASCSHEVPVLMEVWKGKDYCSQQHCLPDFWALCFLLDCSCSLGLRGLILMERRETLFVINLKAVLGDICASC